MNVATIIVNYRTAGLTIDCLKSLAPIARDNPAFSVELIDGGSGDDSPEVLSRAITENQWNHWIRFTPVKENKGFAGANNVGIRLALASQTRPDAVWLLNPDTVVHEGGLQPLLDRLNSSPQIGIVGSRLEFADGELQPSACRFPSIRSEFVDAMRFWIVSRLFSRHEIAPTPPEHAIAIDWVVGASFLVRTEVFEQIGLLDDAYFMYYEEVDFCHRASAAGFQTWYEPKSRVIHFVGQSSGVTGAQAVLKQRPRYWFDSRRRYFLTKHGVLRTALADLAWLTGRATWKLRALIQQKPVEDPPKLWRDFFFNSVFVRGTSL